MSFEKYRNKGVSGLTNLGNTCFVNSCVQILYHTYELTEFCEETEENTSDDYLLLKEWLGLKEVLWSKKCVVSPNRFIHVLHNVSQKKNISIFSDFSQNDSSEFLLFLLNTFHEGLPKIKTHNKIKCKGIDEICQNYLESIIKNGEYSKIIELFYGIKISSLINDKKVISVKPELFFVFHLPIPESNEPTIEECFDLYMRDEILEGENGIINEKTQEKENVVKKTGIWDFPKILIVDFQRFKLYNFIARKKQNFVSYTESLDLSKYLVGKNKGKSYKYELYGISNHSGSVNGGHYTSYIKNVNNKWYSYNDTIVKEIPINEIFSPKAYCLFYRKI
jgi:ubiquitin C-terminal hydrolase